MIHWDSPRSDGVRNMLVRAKRLADFEWRPVAALEVNGRNDGFYQPAPTCVPYTGDTLRGAPYSSARVGYQFMGLDIKLATFLSALKNPLSVLYTRNLGEFSDPNYFCTIKNAYLYYGTVCSAFANYALRLPMHRSTHEWGTAPEFYAISDQTPEGLELGDTLLTIREDDSTGGHVRLVTGVGREEDGHVAEVEITEGTEPVVLCRRYPVQTFEKTLLCCGGRYRIYRYRQLDAVEDPPEEVLPEGRVMCDRGMDANYRTGETVTLAWTEEDMSGKLLLLSPDGTVRDLPTGDSERVEALGTVYRVLPLTGLMPGEYRVRMEGEENALRFAVSRPCAVRLYTEAGEPLERVPYTLCTPEGEPLTEGSPCLYDEKGELRDQVLLGLSGDGRIRPIAAAVRRREGRLVLKTAGRFRDASGKRLGEMAVAALPALYACHLPEGAVVQARFTGEENCYPLYLSWMEEKMISYDQRLLTEAERKAGVVYTRLCRHDNDYATLFLFCRNGYGRMASEPEQIVIC